MRGWQSPRGLVSLNNNINPRFDLHRNCQDYLFRDFGWFSPKVDYTWVTLKKNIFCPGRLHLSADISREFSHKQKSNSQNSDRNINISFAAWVPTSKIYIYIIIICIFSFAKTHDLPFVKYRKGVRIKKLYYRNKFVLEANYCHFVKSYFNTLDFHKKNNGSFVIKAWESESLWQKYNFFIIHHIMIWIIFIKIGYLKC